MQSCLHGPFNEGKANAENYAVPVVRYASRRGDAFLFVDLLEFRWLRDKYGVSWQIIPSALGRMLQDKDPEKSTRVMKAMLQMKKIDIEGLTQAYENR